MRKIILFLLFCLTLSLPIEAQRMVGQYTGANAITVSCSQVTFVPETSSTLVASITSPSTTISGGTYILMFSRTGGTVVPSGITSSSSPALTWTQSLFRAGGSSQPPSIQLSIASVPFSSGGSYTFTSTPSASAGFQSMIVLQCRGVTGTLNTTAAGTGTGTVATSQTSSSYTTTGRTLAVMCASIAGSAKFTAGLMAGTTGNLVGWAGSSSTSNVDAGCEDRTLPSSVSGATSAISWSASLAAASIWIELNY